MNVLASTPYNVAVGGTMFNEHGQASQYWGSTDPVTLGSALSYIPENVWNEVYSLPNAEKAQVFGQEAEGASSVNFS